jgi:hypothetical protein
VKEQGQGLHLLQLPLSPPPSSLGQAADSAAIQAEEIAETITEATASAVDIEMIEKIIK